VVHLLAQLAQLLVQGVIAGAAAVAFIACPWLVFLPAALIDVAADHHCVSVAIDVTHRNPNSRSRSEPELEC